MQDYAHLVKLYIEYVRNVGSILAYSPHNVCSWLIGDESVRAIDYTSFIWRLGDKLLSPAGEKSVPLKMHVLVNAVSP